MYSAFLGFEIVDFMFFQKVNFLTLRSLESALCKVACLCAYFFISIFTHKCEFKRLGSIRHNAVKVECRYLSSSNESLA